MIIYNKDKPLRLGYCMNEIIQGDCLEIMGHFPNGSFDLIITSPPYNLGNNHHTGNNRHKSYDDNMPEEQYQDWQVNVLGECYRVLGENGSMFYNHKNRIKEGESISPYAWIYKTPFIIKRELVWENGSQNFDKIRFYPMTERIYWLVKNKETKLFNAINHKDYWSRSEWIPVKTKGVHKRAFPTQLPLDIISCFPEAKNILDPFSGSGTVGEACKKLNRNFVCIELNPEYVKMAEKRLEQGVFNESKT